MHGIVRDSTGAPVPLATIVVTSRRSAAISTLGDSSGAFRLRVAMGDTGAGPYLLAAHRIGFQPRTYVVSLDTADRPWLVTIRHTSAVLDPVVSTTKRLQRLAQHRDPAGTGTSVGGATLVRAPLDPANPADLAQFMNPGVSAGRGLDVFVTPVSIAGQSPDAASVTVDGAAGTAPVLPAEAVSSAQTLVTTYDVSRGEFTSGQINLRTRSGGEQWQTLVGVRTLAPVLAPFASAPAAGFPFQQTLNMAAGGPLVANWLYVYGAADLGGSVRRSTSLLTASSDELAMLGVSADSVARFAAIARAGGLAPTVRAGAGRLWSLNETGFLRFDAPVTPTSTVALRFDGSTRDIRLGAPLSLSGSPGKRVMETAGALVSWTAAGEAATNELRVSLRSQRTAVDAGIAAPQALVQLSSRVGDSVAYSVVSAGGSGSSPGARRERSAEVANDFVWAPPAGNRRVIAGAAARSDHARRDPLTDSFGSFVFQSLADFEADRPSVFLRAIPDDAARETGARYLAAYLGGGAIVGPHFSFSGGVRGERSSYDAAIPTDVSMSPRAGFRWTPAPSVSISGGSGLFRASGRVAAAALAAGAPRRGTGRLVCAGSSAPPPQWSEYLLDPRTVPAECDGERVASSPAPEPIEFDAGYHVPRVWRSSIAAQAGLGPTHTLSLEAVFSTSRSEPLIVDRNFAGAPRFTLADEAGRPVFVSPQAIDPASGVSSPVSSRIDSTLGVTRLLRSAGRSRILHLDGQLAGVLPGSRGAGLGSVSYSFNVARVEATGIDGPNAPGAPVAGDPNAAQWTRAEYAPRHTVGVTLVRAWSVEWSTTVLSWWRSGTSFTPRVDADINGDGLANDRAFVFAGGDTAAACLRSQRGSIAAEGSCRTGWWNTLDASMAYSPRRHPGFTFTVSAYNVLSAVGRWGQPTLPDDRLLIVRGFDPAARRFRYQVNPNFGGPFPGAVSTAPLSLQLRVRMTMGGDPARPINPRIAATAAGQDTRGVLRAAIVNVPAEVLRLNETHAIDLAPAQIIRLHIVMDSLAERIEANVAALGASIESERRAPLTDGDRARRRALVLEAQQLIERGVAEARETLGPLGWSELPENLRQPSRAIPGVVR